MTSIATVPADDRQPAVAPGRTPDFIIIGAAKSGTTTLYQYLARHPQIAFSSQKEPNFFADQFRRGWDWYTSQFAAARPGQLCGEASTIYTWWQEYPVAAARIGRFAPGARLIYLLRHPVERTYSDYGEQIATHRALGTYGPHLATFESFLNHFPHLVQTSEYIRYIEEYERHFPRSALLCILLEELQHDPAGTLRRVCRHIGVDDTCDLLAAGSVRANEARAYQQWQVRLHLTAGLRRVPFVERLGGLAPRAWRERAYQFLEGTRFGRGVVRRVQQPPLHAATRASLLERYREATHRLAAYLGRDLDHWHR
jgi:LPS sulfotransferase NodH